MFVSKNTGRGRVVSFGSKNNPVEKFQIKTDKGTLFVKEFTEKDAQYNSRIYELTKFFADNFIYNTNDPSLTRYKDPENFEKYLDMLERMTSFYKRMFKNDDGNLTVLEARNSAGELCGAVVTQPLDDISGVKDSQTCYVDSVAVRKDYRRSHVGKILMDKAIECSKDVYTDVFLASDNLAVQFELKNGYRILNYENEAEKAVIDTLNECRGDYPDYITYMDKRIDESNNSKPWYQRVFEKLKKTD